MRDPFFLMCGVLCLYPLIFFALPAFIIGRYRPHFRSPIALDDRSQMNAAQIKARQQAIMRQILEKKKDPVGYGPTN